MAILRRKRHAQEDLDDSMLENLQRLEAVNATHLWGAPPRPELDALTQRAAARLGTPAAYLTLLDDKRQFLASAVRPGGAEGPREGPVSASYCQHVVRADDVLVVDNALTDPLVSDNVATTRDGVRAYLGVPIRKDGYPLGSFCVVDTEPREWTDGDLAVLQQLADEAMATL
ncbi:MAG: GAF domain-containing protein [Actinobacteria bacterium]|nr:GAF domain-containing protein [Actinomycetota bacterium]MBV8957244.1 GAF domain-containing protein [Actinomycetota bacterium]MBV9255081.1 GAF domain-containing protein [Actinomycetota bacterium]MBV9663547.1 GAF domain-containing protein [Actinomycetota bacterium]MBV9936317.1 GAF domain-containing protein [Actinomycetota bacterium]